MYLPVETPTIDEYGGNRPGDNLYAESLVAVDLKTGVEEVALPVRAPSALGSRHVVAGLLMDVTIDGKPRKVIAVPSKQGWLYTFDRITGQPIWPIEERPVPQTDMPGEKTAKTQPFPTKPPPYSRTHVAESDLIDFTPALRAQALENLKLFRWEQIAVRAAGRPELEAARHDQHRQHQRRRELAGLRLRSGDRHLLHAGR